MIWTQIINALYSVIQWITTPIRNTADVVLPVNFTDAMHTASSYISPLNSIVPIDTLMSILALFLIIEGAYFAYKLIMWVIKRFPTQS